MTFQDIARKFRESNAGTDDFKSLSRDVHELMKSDSANAALYFVIGVAAHAYVQQFEDQAVTVKFAESVKALFVRFNEKIGEALTADAATRLALLGEVASEYQFQVKNF